MKLAVLQNYESVSEAAANYVSNRINRFLAANPDKFFTLGLPTGSTPLGMYQKLVEMCRAGRISFARVKTFNMDEYVGFPPEHPQSYHHFMFENFFRYIDIDPNNVHIPNGMAVNLEAECANYEKAIKEAGGIELFVSGIGSDGHIAFNEPFSSLASRTRVQMLNEETVAANARFFQNDRSKIPTKAVTVGVGTIMEAREVLMLVNGAQKAVALQNAIEGGVSHVCTASALQMHPNCLWLVDEDATQELKVKTVKFFRQQFQDSVKSLLLN